MLVFRTVTEMWQGNSLRGYPTWALFFIAILSFSRLPNTICTSMSWSWVCTSPGSGFCSWSTFSWTFRPVSVITPFAVYWGGGGGVTCKAWPGHDQDAVEFALESMIKNWPWSLTPRNFPYGHGPWSKLSKAYILIWSSFMIKIKDCTISKRIGVLYQKLLHECRRHEWW